MFFCRSLQHLTFYTKKIKFVPLNQKYYVCLQVYMKMSQILRPLYLYLLYNVCVVVRWWFILEKGN